MVRAEQERLLQITGRCRKSKWRFLRSHGGVYRGAVRQIQTESNRIKPFDVGKTARFEAQIASREAGSEPFLPSQTRFNLTNFRIGFLVLFPLGVATLPLS